MKIAQLCAVDFTLHHFLLPLMRAMRAAGHEVAGICSEGPLLAQARSEGFSVHGVPIERSLNVLRHRRSYRALVDLLRRERFDIVHVHTPVAAMIGRLAARRAGVPRIVYTAHGFYFHERMRRPQRWAVMALEWLVGRTTDVLFTQAEEDAATARRLRLIKGPLIAAIGNGVDPGEFRPAWDEDERVRIRATLGAEPGQAVILMIGRLVAEKGYVELFEAMRHVDAVLWVAGERLASDHAAPIAAAIRAAETDPLLRERIRLLGYRHDIAELMRGADIFTLPSHREGMPRSVIEAMMSGLPVVGTDVRGTREEIVPEETGLLVPVGYAAQLAAALNRLVRDPALRIAWGKAGRSRALALFREELVVGRQLRMLNLLSASSEEGHDPPRHTFAS